MQDLLMRFTRSVISHPLLRFVEDLNSRILKLKMSWRIKYSFFQSMQFAYETKNQQMSKLIFSLKFLSNSRTRGTILLYTLSAQGACCDMYAVEDVKSKY